HGGPRRVVTPPHPGRTVFGDEGAYTAPQSPRSPRPPPVMVLHATVIARDGRANITFAVCSSTWTAEAHASYLEGSTPGACIGVRAAGDDPSSMQSLPEQYGR